MGTDRVGERAGDLPWHRMDSTWSRGDICKDDLGDASTRDIGGGTRASQFNVQYIIAWHKWQIFGIR